MTFLPFRDINKSIFVVAFLLRSLSSTKQVFCISFAIYGIIANIPCNAFVRHQQAKYFILFLRHLKLDLNNSTIK